MALESLGQERKVFHSEADFHHAFAWALRNKGATEIRLERRFVNREEEPTIDILCSIGAEKVGFELKYSKAR